MPHALRTLAPVTAALAGLLAVLLAAGCGDGSSEKEEPSPSRTADPSRTSDEAKLRTALLTVRDLPKGWSTADLDDDESGDLDTDDETCGRLLDTLDGEDAEADASREFQKGESGPFVANGVASGGVAWAKKTLRDFKRLGTDCTTFTSKDDGSSIDFSVSRLSMPDFGDESGALRLRGRARGGPGDGLTLTVDLVLARVGPSTTGVAHMSVLGPDTKLTPKLMEKAVRKLRGVTGD